MLARAKKLCRWWQQGITIPVGYRAKSVKQRMGDRAGARLFLFFFFYFDAEGFEKFQILIADFELGIGGKSGYQRSLVGRLLALLAHADGSFEDQENIVTALFNARDDFRDLVGIGERFIDRLAQFLHQVFELLIHDSSAGLPSRVPASL